MYASTFSSQQFVVVFSIDRLQIQSSMKEVALYSLVGQGYIVAFDEGTIVACQI